MSEAQVKAWMDVFKLGLPEIVLGVAACMLFVGCTFRRDRVLWGTAALLAIVAAGVVLLTAGQQHATIDALQAEIRQQQDSGQVDESLQIQASQARYVSALLWSRLAIFFQVVALVGGAVLVLSSWYEVRDETAGEYYACLLVIIAGTMLVPSANDLVTLFLSLELISIPTYVVLYLQRHDTAGREAAAKYFLLSVFSSALLLFGFSYLYGLTGTTNVSGIMAGLVQYDPASGRAWYEPDRLPATLLLALVMVVAGLGFRITAFPFHFYAPDVFQGTTTVTAALLAFVPKLAGFAALLRVLGFVDSPSIIPGLALGPRVPILFITMAALTMVVGNVLALLQDNLRRLLAYSSVAHAGYMLVGLAAAPGLVKAPDSGLEAVVFYLVAYGAMTLGTFAVLAYLEGRDRSLESVDDLAGLSRDHPLLALMLTLFLLSLIGMPGTAGFVGKLLLLLAALAVEDQAVMPAEYGRLFPYLALLLAITSAIGAWYYLRLVAAMYLRSPLQSREIPRRWPIVAAIAICAIITVAAGVYPEPLVRLGRLAVLPSP